MIRKNFLAAGAMAAVMGAALPVQAADIVIGVPNWPSVRATAHILKVALENNLGVEVELQNGTNPIVFEAMDSGARQVHPEVWLPNQQNLHDTFVKEKQSVVMNPNGVPAFTGMCVTDHTAEATGIKTLVGPDRSRHGEEVRHRRRRQR